MKTRCCLCLFIDVKTGVNRDVRINKETYNTNDDSTEFKLTNDFEC